MEICNFFPILKLENIIKMFQTLFECLKNWRNFIIKEFYCGYAISAVSLITNNKNSTFYL